MKSPRRKGGGYFYWEIERGGGSEEGSRGGAHRRWEGVAGRGGGGVNIFFRGRNVTKSSFGLFFGKCSKSPLRAVTEKSFYGRKFYRIMIGVLSKAPCSPQEKGLLPKSISVGLALGLSQEFLERSPGHLLNKSVIE